MNTKDIQQNLKTLTDNLNQDLFHDDFIYEFLLCFGFSKSVVTRIKKGDFNLSKSQGEVFYKKKLFFKPAESEQLLSTIDEVAKDNGILKHSPRFVIVTDYQQLVAKDLNKLTTLDISITELSEHVAFFMPLAGSEVYKSSNEEDADRNAAYKMAELYDLLRIENPDIYQSKQAIHELNVFLSRLLFCFFAEDTGIFKTESVFTDTLVLHTDDSGADTHEFLDTLFARLKSKDNTGFATHFDQFEYVNGGLFAKTISSPKFSAKARKVLMQLGGLNWKDINPDIFGSMIQAVVIDDYRSDLGMHYTSVPNIKKLIKPLFLDALYEVYENATSVNQLHKLINRLASIKFFDPACGSGNFLIITYKEIRDLEIKIIQKIIDLEEDNAQQSMVFTTQIQLSQFYGIEIDDFAHEVAILSLWLAEHQMNQVFDDRLLDYGQSEPILPLKPSGRIIQDNATRKEWQEVCPISVDDEVYVIGNPPYYGSRKQNKEQKNDLKHVFEKNYKSLDYIATWFYLGAKYIDGYNAQCAFVSTNSICQGLLVSLIWQRILSERIEIGFAYQSFKWTNNAKGNAGVTVIIVGLRNQSNKPKFLFEGNIQKEVKNISPYLLDAPDIIVSKREKALSSFPTMNFGNMPADGGNLLLTSNEKDELLALEPDAAKWLKKIISANEFLNGSNRFCLWLEDVDEKEYSKLPRVKERVDKTYQVRLNSSRPKLAEIPHLFAQITQNPNKDFILIPRHSSENREYIPIGYFDSSYKASDSNLIISTENPWLFAVITSKMHMVWVRAVGGKLKTDYRYSAKLCYNTFPFPDIDSAQKETLSDYVFDILDARANHTGKTMAWMYNPDTMPSDLKQAHEALDTAIERCYRLKPFTSDTERLEYLFKEYEKMIQAEASQAKKT